MERGKFNPEGEAEEWCNFLKPHIGGTHAVAFSPILVDGEEEIAGDVSITYFGKLIDVGKDNEGYFAIVDLEKAAMYPNMRSALPNELIVDTETDFTLRMAAQDLLEEEHPEVKEEEDLPIEKGIQTFYLKNTSFWVVTTETSS